jgi:hypothetical protein
LLRGNARRDILKIVTPESVMRDSCRILLFAGPFAFAGCRQPAVSLSTPATDSGAFVIMLGRDTVSAESFTRIGDQVDGVIVRRIPRTVVIRYSMQLTASGLPSRLEYHTRLADGGMLPNGARTIVTTFRSDSAMTEIHRDSVITRRAAARNAYPELDGAVSLYAIPISSLERSGRDSADFETYVPGASRGSVTPVVKRAPRRYWVYSEGNPIEVVTDAAGRVLSVDGSRTTVRIQSRRQLPFDVIGLARAFATSEHTAGPIVALSPRDSVTVTIGTARLSIDYGRPAARGRRIWGPAGVLGDTLWRTGANASTKFATTRSISFGGRVLPAGTYRIMTLAIPGRYQLIFYVTDREVLRVPLHATALSPIVDRFIILVEPTDDRAGVLHLRWDSLDLSAPFTVASE